MLSGFCFDWALDVFGDVFFVPMKYGQIDAKGYAIWEEKVS
jgi:hypothetical protein